MAINGQISQIKTTATVYAVIIMESTIFKMRFGRCEIVTGFGCH